MASIIQPPNNGLVTETAQQYYAGSQQFRGDAGNTANQEFTTTFNTDLYLGSYDPTNPNYSLNNFKIYTSTLGTPGTWTEYTAAYELNGDIIKIIVKVDAVGVVC